MNCHERRFRVFSTVNETGRRQCRFSTHWRRQAHGDELHEIGFELNRCGVDCQLLFLLRQQG
jgi:hypothetical protein